MAEATIADWTETTLIKFLRDYMEQQPQAYIPTLRVDALTITNKLTLADLLTLTKAPNFTTVGSVGAAAFTGTWVNRGGAYAPAAYWKDPLGFVHIRGVIKSGTINTVAFVLPPGYRPPTQEIVPCAANGAYGEMEILADGSVKPTVGSTTSFSINHRFRIT